MLLLKIFQKQPLMQKTKSMTQNQRPSVIISPGRDRTSTEKGVNRTFKHSNTYRHVETEDQKTLRIEKTGDVYKANQIRNYMITDFCDNINELDEHLADKLEIYNEKFTNLLPVSKRWKRFTEY